MEGNIRMINLPISLILLAGAFLNACNSNQQPAIKITEKTNILETQLYTWNRVALGEASACSDGSEYSIFTRKGNSYKVILFFGGGGLCWDDPTCTNPFVEYQQDGYYTSKIDPQLLASNLGGIIDIEREDNVFKDWNLVYIPYCTGDLHIGRKKNTYKDEDGQTVTVSHQGQTNMIAAFNWIFRHFHTPERLLIIGEDIGGLGSLFWTLALGKNYPDVPIYQLTDGAWLSSESWPKIVNSWNANTENVFGYKIDEDIYGDALLNTAKALEGRNITFLQLANVADETLPHYSQKMIENAPTSTDAQQNWSEGMLQAMAAYDDSLSNYHYFLTDWQEEGGNTSHTFLSNERFYQCEENGTTLQQWLKMVVLEGETSSVER
jgi:hypothetical protein